MNLDYSTLELLRRSHPSWRLLQSDHASLVVSFLARTFIVPNVRAMAQADLAEALEDELYGLREQLGTGAFPKAALSYLDDWAANEKGWLRKFYPQGTDEPHFDLTPAAEKTIAWLGTLADRSFVGTESRLLTLFQLLKQMSEGSESDPQARIAELQKRRDDIDEEIARAQTGDIALLDATELKDRFQQFITLARELLTDFREVEQNFRGLDRRVRERIARWDGAKGALLEEILGERDAISDSDQGKSFRAFWDFLMSSSRQEELSALLERVLALPAVAEMKPDSRTNRLHHDWLEAGEHTQRMVAVLSQQLRRFLDDQAWLENRRIMDILREVEVRALAVREQPPSIPVMEIDDIAADIELPMERPLYVPLLRPRITNMPLETGNADTDAAALYSQVVIDRATLAWHIRHVLQDRPQVTLRELCVMHPLQQGLAELITYLQLGSDTFQTVIDESVLDTVRWQSKSRNGHEHIRQARFPRVIFSR